eukprot:TRINITY_DN10920_c0_g1_i1.p3 TRINITY_DN10920_c0_g1~~TRINITY_DN10920_c0_g1_i1.p3  ORF type:complete len:193 (-),score=95.07 TRINITY_DN10920_c0_g1_i1:74-652(-)
MFTTFYHRAYLTAGAWHPVRPGVFLTTRMDGAMDVWDLLYKQSAPVLSLQVSDYALHTLRLQQDGRHVAVGGVDGCTSLLELSGGLAEMARDEKNVIGQMLEREAQRDKNLIQRAREAKQRRRKSSSHMRPERDIGSIEEAALAELTDTFLKDVQYAEQRAAKAQDAKRLQHEQRLVELDQADLSADGLGPE